MSVETNAGYIQDLSEIQNSIKKNEEEIDTLKEFKDNIGSIISTKVSVPSKSIGAQSTVISTINATVSSSQGIYVPLTVYMSAKSTGPSATSVSVSGFGVVEQNTAQVQISQSNGAGTTQTAPGGTATVYWLRVK